jgi:hypothetical protein
MNDIGITRHAVRRMAQRSFREDDLDLIMMIGTEVEDGYLVRAKDCQAAERELKRLLDQVRRLEGKRLVVEGGSVITAYRPGRETGRRLMRGAGDRELAA